MPLKICGWTSAARKGPPEVFHRLQQRIGLGAAWRRALAAQPGAKTIQLPAQFAPQAIDRFQGKGQPQLFRGGFERKPRQHFYEPSPHPWSRQRVPW